MSAPGGISTGVLVMAYGTPASTETIAEYYTHIRHGHPPEDRQLADLVRRYDAIGGISPMRARTRAQMDAIRVSLDNSDVGRFKVALGQKHAAPFIEDGIAELAASGVEQIVGVVLAPHYSAASIGEYHGRGTAAARNTGVEYRGIDDWSDAPSLISFMASAVQLKLAQMPSTTRVFFTAHSLPERVLNGDPYPDRLAASARATASVAGLDDAMWDLAWQSAGRTKDAWRGPDILELIREIGDGGDSRGVLVVPQGFTSDHLEVLYDLDIEAAALAREVGLAFARTEVVNDDRDVMFDVSQKIIEVAER